MKKHKFVEMFWVKKDYDLVPVSLFWGLIKFEYKRKMEEERIPSGVCVICEKPRDLH